jgi:four helix bundle protein
MSTINRFEDIEAWQLARELCKSVYEITSRGDFYKDYSLRDQIRRSSGSVMDNIAEGFDRDGTAEFKQFLSVSKGSAGEVRSQLYRAYDCKYISEDEFKLLMDRMINVSGKLTNLIKYLKTTEIKGNKFGK